MFDVCVAEEGRRVGREGTLGFAAKLFRLGSKGTMLRLWWGGMLVFLQLFDDVAWHGSVEGACIVIPFEVYSAVEVAIPIFGGFIFLFDAHDKVVDIFLMHIFHAKIVDNKCEGYGAWCVLPEAGHLLAFKISMGGKAFLEELVGQDAGLGKSPHGTLHFQINVSIEDFVLKGILFDNPQGKKGKRDAHVFESVKRGRKVEVFDVKGHILSSWRAEHAVPKEFGHHDVGHPCCEFAGVIDEVPTGCDSDSIGICFLGAMIDDPPRVRNNSVFGDVGDVEGEHDEHCICSFFACLVVTMTHSSKVFSKRRHPNFRSCRIVHQAFIAADDFVGDGMNHGHGVLFEVLGGESVIVQFRRSVVGHIVGLLRHEELCNGLLAD